MLKTVALILIKLLKTTQNLESLEKLKQAQPQKALKLNLVLPPKK